MDYGNRLHVSRSSSRPCLRSSRGALRLVVDTDAHRSFHLDPVLAALQREAFIAAQIPGT